MNRHPRCFAPQQRRHNDWLTLHEVRPLAFEPAGVWSRSTMTPGSGLSRSHSGFARALGVGGPVQPLVVAPPARRWLSRSRADFSLGSGEHELCSTFCPTRVATHTPRPVPTNLSAALAIYLISKDK